MNINYHKLGLKRKKKLCIIAIQVSTGKKYLQMASYAAHICQKGYYIINSVNDLMNFLPNKMTDFDHARNLAIGEVFTSCPGVNAVALDSQHV